MRWSPTFPQRVLHIPLMQKVGHMVMEALWGESGRMLSIPSMAETTSHMTRNVSRYSPDCALLYSRLWMTELRIPEGLDVTVPPSALRLMTVMWLRPFWMRTPVAWTPFVLPSGR